MQISKGIFIFISLLFVFIIKTFIENIIHFVKGYGAVKFSGLGTDGFFDRCSPFQYVEPGRVSIGERIYLFFYTLFNFFIVIIFLLAFMKYGKGIISN